jgi:S-ribosylhomocysteine lyase LuxS involved in autoinducer biosynthesis
MLYTEIISVCSEIHTKHINTVCGQNVELLNVKLCGIYSKHSALKAQLTADVYTDLL